MIRGFIKLHRSTTEWEWFSDSKMVHVFIFLLLKANHSKGRFKGIELNSGQFICGRKVIAEKTGISEQSVRTCLKRLKSTNELTITPTKGIDGIYSVFELNSWEKYQIKDESTTTSTTTSTEDQPRLNHALTTNKNDNNVDNDKNDIIEDLKGSVSLSSFSIPNFRTSKTKNEFKKKVEARYKSFNSETLFDELGQKLITSSHLLSQKWFNVQWLFKTDDNLEKFLNGNYDSFGKSGFEKKGLTDAELIAIQKQYEDEENAKQQIDI